MSNFWRRRRRRWWKESGKRAEELQILREKAKSKLEELR